MMPSLPPDVRALLGVFLPRLDAAVPGTIEGLYLVGSLALGDYRPGRSDVDFVAIVPERPGTKAMESLDQVHTLMRTDYPLPHLDGIYVTWSQLLRDPTTLADVPYSHEGRFHSAGGFEANPAVWLTLRDHPVAIRGQASPRVHHDAEELCRWTVQNLNTYWKGLVEQVRAAVRAGRAVPDDAVAWCVPGVLRLHYTLTTGGITSKSGACLYGLETLPPSRHPIIAEALALHRGQPTSYVDLRHRAQDALSLMEAVIRDADAR